MRALAAFETFLLSRIGMCRKSKNHLKSLLSSALCRYPYTNHSCKSRHSIVRNHSKEESPPEFYLTQVRVPQLYRKFLCILLLKTQHLGTNSREMLLPVLRSNKIRELADQSHRSCCLTKLLVAH